MTNKPSALPQTRLLHLTVLLGGLTTLAVELAAARLMGAYFGVSNLVWTTIIGLILMYLAAGYYLGGRLADQFPRIDVFYRLAAWGSFLSGLVPFVGRALLPAVAAAGLPLAQAVALSIALLYTLPITILGCLSPFAVRLTFRTVDEAGQTTGRIYAFATLGSIIGSLAPGLYGLPTLGTTQTFLVFSTPLLCCALYGLFKENRIGFLRLVWMPVAFFLLLVLVP